MLSTVRINLKRKKKEHIIVYSVNLSVLSFFTQLRSFFLFTCLYFYMQSNQTIIEYKSFFDRFLCVDCTMGAAILHDQVQQMIYGHYWRCHPTGGGGGVSMTWGICVPLQHSLAILTTDKIRQKAHSFL